MATTSPPGPPTRTRRVTVHLPGGHHDLQLTGDDTITIDIDGTPLLGVDADGAGWWPGPEAAWERLRPGGAQTDRTVAIDGITTEAMWHDLEKTLGLRRHELGRWKAWAADRTKIFTADYDLDTAIGWAIANGLPYEDERAVRHTPTHLSTTGGPHRSPLVKVDTDALRAWLTDRQHTASEPGPLWRPAAHEVADLVGTLTRDPSTTAQQAWSAPRVRSVYSCHLATGQVLFVADLQPHGRICTAALDDNDLSDSWQHIGIDAAIHTITNLATRLNQADPNRHQPRNAAGR